MSKLNEWLKKHGLTDELVAEAEGIAAEDAQAELDKTVAGLKSKNTELLNKLKNPSDDIEKNPKFILIQSELDEAKANLAKAQANEAAAKTAQAKAEKERDDKVKASDSMVADLLIDGGLTAAFSGAVKPAHLEAVKLLHKAKFTIEKGEDGKPRAVATVMENGTAKKLDPKAYVSAWLGTDEGKEWALAGANAGGGAGGSNGGAGGKAWKDMSLDERTALYHSNPAQAEALAAASK